MIYMIWPKYFQNGDLRPWDQNKVQIQILLFSGDSDKLINCFGAISLLANPGKWDFEESLC